MMKMLIDVDTGVDDAQAIIMALAHPEVEIIGITVVSGNINVDQGSLNTLRVLKLCGKLGKVPVFSGSDQPMLGGGSYATKFHGINGLGGFTEEDTPGVEYLEKEHAVPALIRLVNKYPGEITMVALGPLTNVALAIRLDNSFLGKLKDLVIMGGNVTGRGNITVSGEFNFWRDPEAAHVVLSSIQCPTKVISWETCLTVQHSWEWYNELINQDTPKTRFFKSITTESVNRLKNVVKRSFWHSCDPCAMAIALNSQVKKSSGEYHCSVELQGQHTRGQMVVDYNDLLGKDTKVELVFSLNNDLVREEFRKMLL